MCRTVVFMKRTLAAFALVLAIGCSGDAMTSGGSDLFNEADVEFVQGMIPHHEDAIRMADMVTSSAVSAATADLVSDIRAAQEPEIAQLRGLLSQWGVEENPHAMHMMDDASMHGMMTQDDYRALESAVGVVFERMWLEMMIEHHQGAVQMSEVVLADGKHPVVRELATAIAAVQRDEISRMTALLDKL